MNRKTCISLRIATLCGVLAVLGIGKALLAQSPLELYNQALVRERASGELEQAIELYQRVARESTVDRGLAAQALINAAQAYEKLGKTEASRSLYANVMRTYPEQTAQSDAARQRLSDTGTVEGIVTRSGTGEPIANAKVSLSGGPFDPAALQQLLRFFSSRGVVVLPPSGGQDEEKFLQTLFDAAAARGVSTRNPEVQTALAQFTTANDSRFKGTTDNAGRFVIKSVLPGRYTLHPDREGFFSDDSDGSAAERVTVAAGKTVLSALSLISGAIISGRVMDSAGLPLSNANVQAFSLLYQNGFAVLQPVTSKTTDDRGEYRLFWLSAGEYLIAAVQGGGGRFISTGTIVNFAGGNAVAGAPPPPPPPPPPPSDGAVSSSELRTFYPGTPDVAMAIPVVVRQGAQVAGIDITLRPAQTFRISGEIRSVAMSPSAQPNPNAIANARIVLAARDSSVPEEIGATILAQVPLMPSGNQYVGTFQLDGILPGSYDLRTWTDEANPDGGSQLTFASAPVDVYGKDVTGVSLEIFPSVRVKGTVSVDGHAPGSAEVRVALQVDGSAAKRPSLQGLARRPVLAGAQDGAFMIPAVTAGRFRVQPGPGLTPDLYVADVLQGGRSVFDSGFDVGRDSPPPLQVIVRSGAGALEGSVQGTAGKPAANVAVVLVPPMDRRQNRALYRTATTGPDGRFRIEGIAPGDYDVFAWQNMPEGAYFNSRFVAHHQDRARRISVTQSAKSTVSLTAVAAIEQ